MRFYCFLLLLIHGCVSLEAPLNDEEQDVRIFKDMSDCEYKHISFVSVYTGSVFWLFEGNEQANLSWLKRKAVELGGNAVILREYRERSHSFWGTGLMTQSNGDVIKCKKGKATPAVEKTP